MFVVVVVVVVVDVHDSYCVGCDWFVIGVHDSSRVGCISNCTLLYVRKFFLREIFFLKRYHWTRQPALLMTFGTNTLYCKYEPRYVKLIGIRISLFETRLL